MGGIALVAPRGAAGQSLLERPPNLWGTRVGTSGTVYPHFLQRFEATDAPTRKVINYPTFLLGATLPGHTMVGARYATNSPLVTGFPNEWEFFGRCAALARERGAPVDVAAHGAHNRAAESLDAEHPRDTHSALHDHAADHAGLTALALLTVACFSEEPGRLARMR